MEPIISPWTIYLVNTLDSINAAVFMLTIIFGISSIPLYDENEEKQPTCFKVTVSIFIICLLLTIFLPSKQTAWMMISASYATPDNIQVFQNNLIDFAKQISQVIK